MSNFSFNYSQLETEIYNYHFYRASLNLLNANTGQILDVLNKEDIDVLRLKLMASHIDVLKFLTTLHMPFEIYNINYINKLDIKHYRDVNLPEDVIFKVIENPHNDVKFQEILETVITSENWVEYTGWLSDSIMPKQRRLEVAVNYYKSSFYSLSEHPFYTFLVVNGVEVGITVGKFESDVYQGALFGLLPEYRKKGLAKYFYQLMVEEMRRRGAVYFRNEVNLFNTNSQSSANNRNIQADDYYFNVSIFPFRKLDNSFIKVALTSIGESGWLELAKELYPKCQILDMKNNFTVCPASNDSEALYRCIDLKENCIMIVGHVIKGERVEASTYITLLKST